MKTSISIGLKAIPPSAGLSRRTHKLSSVAIVSHHIKQQPRIYLTVERDRDLEDEIQRCKGTL